MTWKERGRKGGLRKNHCQILSGTGFIARCLHISCVLISRPHDPGSEIGFPCHRSIVPRLVRVLPRVEMPLCDRREASITSSMRFRVQPPWKTFVKDRDIGYVFPKIIDESRGQSQKMRTAERDCCCVEDGLLDEVGKVGEISPGLLDGSIIGDLFS